MTQKKYIVTDDQLQNLVDALHLRYGMARLNRTEVNRMIDFYECRAVPVEPEVVKVERWILLDRNGDTFGIAYSDEQTAREACCEFDKANRFIKLEGSYAK